MSHVLVVSGLQAEVAALREAVMGLQAQLDALAAALRHQEQRITQLQFDQLRTARANPVYDGLSDSPSDEA